MKPRQLRQAQRLNLDDPQVRSFAAQCGLSEHPVSVRLVGVLEKDVAIQLERLKAAYGDRIQLTQPRYSAKGKAWVCYGTIIA